MNPPNHIKIQPHIHNAHNHKSMKKIYQIKIKLHILLNLVILEILREVVEIQIQLNHVMFISLIIINKK
jgi:hypothetical protein